MAAGGVSTVYCYQDVVGGVCLEASVEIITIRMVPRGACTDYCNPDCDKRCLYRLLQSIWVTEGVYTDYYNPDCSLSKLWHSRWWQEVSLQTFTLQMVAGGVSRECASPRGTLSGRWAAESGQVSTHTSWLGQPASQGELQTYVQISTYLLCNQNNLCTLLHQTHCTQYFTVFPLPGKKLLKNTSS
jgi:hypothetical protein